MSQRAMGGAGPERPGPPGLRAEMVSSGAEVRGVERTRLASGLRVVTEAMPELRSVAVGFWVGTGAVDETGEQLGASHFLEHLLFKGTDTRSAAEIAHAVESVGGDMNAFTTQEYTAFYVRVPDDHLALALDILSDVVWEPAFRPDEVDSERQVILEEIGMRDDTPDDVVHELFAEALYPEHPLGRSVLGTRESIAAMPREAIAAYHGEHYHPANVVVAAAGNLDHERVVELVEARLPQQSGARPARAQSRLVAPRAVIGRRRPTEQAHLVVGMRSIARDDPDRYALSVMNQAFGGGMSSRLFQEVREKRGLAYSVYSYRAAYEDTGALGVYAGTAPERVRETLAVIEGELARLVAEGLPEEELAAAKGHLRGSTALSLESSSSRMHRIGRSELTLGEVPSVDELVASVEAVEPDDVGRVIERVLANEAQVLSVVGPFDPEDFA
ncbi:MAG: insulinase family protein [Actinobacteria bacterium]|nr:insulinase family protein [Actinomycetota bacterium]